MKKRFRALFSGTVQGVGFRFATERAARRFPVTGCVRNLSNGKVEVVAEGEEKPLQEFLGEIRLTWKSYLQDAAVTWENPTGEFQGFGIKL